MKAFIISLKDGWMKRFAQCASFHFSYRIWIFSFDLWTKAVTVYHRWICPNHEFYHEFGYLSLLAECFCFICAFKVAEYLSDPLCRGIFAGDSRLLSLSSCFPAVYQYENQHGSIIKGAFLTKEGTCIYISEGRLLESRRSDPLLTIVDPSHSPPLKIGDLLTKVINF